MESVAATTALSRRNAAVGRVLAVDVNTTEWIRAFRLNQCNKVVGQFVSHMGPTSWSHRVNVANAGSTVVDTPRDVWSAHAGGGVLHMCSFCKNVLNNDTTITVQFNPILTSPYLLVCGSCVQKMS